MISQKNGKSQQVYRQAFADSQNIGMKNWIFEIGLTPAFWDREV